MSTSIPLSEKVQIATDTLNVTTPQNVSVNGTETKYVQTITFIPPASVTYGSTLNLNSYAKSSSGLPLVFTVASGPAKLSGTTVTFTGVGTVSIQASQPGDNAYAAALAYVATIPVTKALLKVEGSNMVRDYGKPNPPLAYLITGWVNGDTMSAISGTPRLFTRAVTSSPLGTYAIVVAAGTLSAANYSFTFQNGSLTIRQATPAIHWVAPAAITYGTILSDRQLDATSSVAGTFAYSPALRARLTAGRHTLSLVFTPTNTMDYRTAKAEVYLIVDKKTLTVTATNAAVAYDHPLPKLKFTVGVFAYGETSSVLSGVPRETTSAREGSAVGKYPIDISQGTLSAANYAFAFKDGTLTITGATASAAREMKQLPNAQFPLPDGSVTEATPGRSE
jgi:hypothetical protein